MMQPKIMELDCLVLAAGNSSRFGSCKLVADWHGQPLVLASITAAQSLMPERILVVGGAYYEQLQQLKTLHSANSPRVELIECLDWEMGMGHSLAFGVSQLNSKNAVMVLLGDQPLVTAQDLQNLYRFYCVNPSKIICASYAKTLGVPAIFPTEFKTQLTQCTGDRGAKSLFSNNPSRLLAVSMPSAQYDVDTLQMLAYLQL
jgi:molybdenum cofactor cytidylyltransferase